MSTLTQLFTSIANSIRGKDGTTATIAAENFSARIAAIPTGELTEQEYEEALDLTEQILSIPSLYTPIQYVESTGTQYIDLNYIPSNYTDFEIKLATTEENPSVIRRILGGYNSNNRYELALHYNETDGIFINYYSTSNYSRYIPVLNQPFVIKKKGTSFIVPNSTVSLSSATFSPEKKSFLFASNRQSTSKFIGRIYYLKMYESNAIVKSLIPCIRESDDEIGFYDLVNNEFLTNSGTGTFIAGPIIQ